jgi:FlaA1/EpsC-like NDP-sugar epimerase|tara:strand:+ start:29 stop:268 length:240 start_codon:yes stop_codon:yes gene_type:complete
MDQIDDIPLYRGRTVKPSEPVDFFFDLADGCRMIMYSAGDGESSEVWTLDIPEGMKIICPHGEIFSMFDYFATEKVGGQ